MQEWGEEQMWRDWEGSRIEMHNVFLLTKRFTDIFTRIRDICHNL